MTLQQRRIHAHIHICYNGIVRETCNATKSNKVAISSAMRVHMCTYDIQVFAYSCVCVCLSLHARVRKSITAYAASQMSCDLSLNIYLYIYGYVFYCICVCTYTHTAAFAYGHACTIFLLEQNSAAFPHFVGTLVSSYLCSLSVVAFVVHCVIVVYAVAATCRLRQHINFTSYVLCFFPFLFISLLLHFSHKHTYTHTCMSVCMRAPLSPIGFTSECIVKGVRRLVLGRLHANAIYFIVMYSQHCILLGFQSRVPL